MEPMSKPPKQTKITLMITYDLEAKMMHITGIPDDRLQTLGMLEMARHQIEKHWNKIDQDKVHIALDRAFG